MTERTPSDHRSILFVCLGNICRSPMAEGVMTHLATEAGDAHRWTIDSAGTGSWHEGERADPRARETAARNGVELTSRARQAGPEDFSSFDLILAMDRSNLDDLARVQAEAGADATATLRLFREYDPEAEGADGDGRDVPDPYFGVADGFDEVYEMVRRTCQRILEVEAPS